MTERSMDVAALGARVRLRFAEDVPAELEDAVRHAWSGAQTSPGGPDAEVEITPTTDLTSYLGYLSSHVTMAAIGHQQGSLVMLHAGAVALPDGRVVAFVGPSGRGKTTLTAALSREYGYVTDETVGVAEDLTVHPHRKPFSLVEGSGPKRQAPPADVGARELPPAALRLAGLVLLERHDDPTEPWLEPLSLVDAIIGMAPETSFLSQLPTPLQRLATLHDAVGGIKRLQYSDAASVVPSVRDAVGTPRASNWRPAPDVGATGERTLVDAIDTDGRIIVMVDTDVVVLDGIAPTIWRSLSTATDMASLVRSVIAEHGEPPDGGATELVRAALDEIRLLLGHQGEWPFATESGSG